MLVNNHEISGDEPFPVPHLDGFVYDAAGRGGTTNIEVDKDGNRVREYVSLAGTHNNCAGGKHAVGHLADLRGDREPERPRASAHGYVFEVDPYDQDGEPRPEADQGARPVRARGRGRGPGQGQIYLTEDAGNPNGLLYRWTPPAAALPLRKGSLRALADDAGDAGRDGALDADGALRPRPVRGDRRPARRTT